MKLDINRLKSLTTFMYVFKFIAWNGICEKMLQI